MMLLFPLLPFYHSAHFFFPRSLVSPTSYRQRIELGGVLKSDGSHVGLHM